jgi:hypothetical protein
MGCQCNCYQTCYLHQNRAIINVITKLITSAMANPFFSGRIPVSLANKIDNHLLVTGETRSELLIRLLRIEIGEINDNKDDNINNDVINDLLLRVKKLEKLANFQNDGNGENVKLKISQPKESKDEKIIPSESQITLTKTQALYLKQIKDMVAKSDKAKTKKFLDLELVVQLGDDLILTNLGEAVLEKYGTV